MERNEKTNETTTQSHRYERDGRRAVLFKTHKGAYEGFFGGPEYFQARQYGYDFQRAKWDIDKWINHGVTPEPLGEDDGQETDE